MYSHNIQVLSDSNAEVDFIIVSEKSGFRHFYRVCAKLSVLNSETQMTSEKEERTEKQLTSGKWEVIGSDVSLIVLK